MLVIYRGRHVSKMIELGLQQEDGSVAFVLTSKTNWRIGDTVEKLALKLPPFATDVCACCSKQTAIIDRGVPLCKDHFAKQEKITQRRNRDCYGKKISSKKIPKEDKLDELFD